MPDHELHIDLLKCEFCEQHNKLLDFCSACGRARTKYIIAPRHHYRLDRGSDFRCRTCFSQRTTPLCAYCNTGMKFTANAIRPSSGDEHQSFVRTRTGKPSAKLRLKRLDFLASLQGWKCAICQQEFGDTLEDVDLDHILPRSLGGTSTLKNLQATHRKCNNHFGSRTDKPSRHLASAIAAAPRSEARSTAESATAS
mgnify:CR=1 FL=1